MKKLLTLIIFFFIVIYSASSLKTFEINETEKISLALEAQDPDSDKLTYIFTEPLDSNGEWQTTYGDSGRHTTTITVSDGENEVSEEVVIIVNRKEEMPVIYDFEPKESYIIIDEGEEIKFIVRASDLNNDELDYQWVLDDEIYTNGNQLNFPTGYNDAGEYKISAIISDGIFIVTKKWDVKVNDVDVDALLEQIEDVIVYETKTVSLKLPDFERYGLKYSISEPIGDDNKWETDFGDVGEYVVTVKAEGKDYSKEEEVKITVQKNDRAPKFIGLRDVKIMENEELRIELKAVDPDNDNVFFSVVDGPKNLKLDGSVFRWKPDFGFVQKDNLMDHILDKFRLLSRNIDVIFIVQSNELTDEIRIKINVKNANSNFVLEPIEDIEVDEGQDIVINPTYNDPDNNKVSFSYSGFMNNNKISTDFNDAGEYVVKVIATNGFFTETRFVNIKVNDVNRKPVFNMIENAEVIEGNELRIELSANDPDNDAVSYSAKKLPKGAKLKDNLFVWKPDFNVVDGTQKELSLNFIATDGIDQDEQKVKITILNNNRAPKIIDYSSSLVAYKGQPILFDVNAIDEDDDELKYEWNFGLFDKFEDINQHQRIFITTGSKKVKVTVSDGLDTVSKVWNVEVV